MKKDFETKEFIITFYKWATLQSKLQQYLIDHEEAARDITDEVILQQGPGGI